MLSHTTPTLAEAESAARAGATFKDILPILRGLSLDEFGELFVTTPLPNYPRLSKVLPAMAPVDVQQTWTGRSGMRLYPQTSQFVRCIEAAYARHTGKRLANEIILDFGCGYGRLIRMMYYYTDPDRIWGVDPWENSLNHCRSVALPANFRRSAEVPERLPVDVEFGFGFSFSVFTHLTDQATAGCLSAIRKSFKKGGMFVPTLRPVEYWARLLDSSRSTSDHYKSLSHQVITKAESDHRQNGYGFVPHINPNVRNYGDSSFAMEFFCKQDGWKMLGYDTLLDDQHQVLVYLQAA